MLAKSGDIYAIEIDISGPWVRSVHVPKQRVHEFDAVRKIFQR